MLMMSFNHSAIAGDFEDGVAAHDKGDIATAVRLWTSSAEQGNASARFTLGLMYDLGNGVAQDYKTAIKWYTLAAEQRNSSAQFNLGFMYEHGQGVAQDLNTAVKWYTLAAEQGNASAQNNLGSNYYHGKGEPKDFVKAYMWYNIAAIDGKSINASSNRDIVAEEMTPPQIKKAQDATNRCIKQNFKNCD